MHPNVTPHPGARTILSAGTPKREPLIQERGESCPLVHPGPPPPPSLICALALALCITPALSDSAEVPTPRQPADLYQTTNVWSIHLRFTPEDWKAMEPKGGGGFPFFGPPPDDNRGPNNVGPASFLAPAFLKQGDTNQDGRLSPDEFSSLGNRWFSTWDAQNRGVLNAEQLRDGLNKTFESPPGDPGRRGPSFVLKGPEGRRNGLASVMGIEFVTVPANLEIAGATLTNVGVRYKGNGTFLMARGSIKRSLKIDLSEHVKGRKWAGVTKLNLHNCVTDATWMNEVLSYRLFRDAGVLAPRTAYARVFVTVPGKYERRYFGLYSLVENVDANFIQDRFNTRLGAIFKPVTPELFKDLGDDWAAYRQTYDPKTTVTPAETDRVIAFARLVTHADDAAFAKQLPEFLDLDRFARFMAITTWLSTLDSILGPGQNYYIYLDPKTHRFQFLPWDLDHSFGQFPLTGTQLQREQLSIHQPWQGDNRFLERVFRVDAFKQTYLEHLRRLSGSLLQPERFHQQVDELADAIRPAIKEESSSMLARFNKAVATESPTDKGRASGGGFSFLQPPKPIKRFVGPRAQSVAAQLDGSAKGELLPRSPFGPPRDDRGPDTGRPPNGPDRPGVGALLGDSFLSALDADKDQSISKTEFTKGFEALFKSWDANANLALTESELRTGIARDLPGPTPAKPSQPESPNPP